MPVAIIYIPNVGEKYIPSLSISRRHLDFLHSTDYRYDFKNQIVFVVMQLYGEIQPPTARVLLKLKTGEGVKALSKIPNQHCSIQLCCVITDFDTHFLILLDSIHESGTEHFLSQNEREQCPEHSAARGAQKSTGTTASPPPSFTWLSVKPGKGPCRKGGRGVWYTEHSKANCRPGFFKAPVPAKWSDQGTSEPKARLLRLI